jgi:hypothetical protein
MFHEYDTANQSLINEYCNNQMTPHPSLHQIALISAPISNCSVESCAGSII